MAMKKFLLATLLATSSLCAHAQSQPERPRITGIDHVSFYTTQPKGVKQLYSGVLGLASAEPIEKGETVRYLVGKQWVGYSPAPDPKSANRMDHVAFTTDNVSHLHAYLAANGLKVESITEGSDHRHSFIAIDPEQNRIEFVEKANRLTFQIHRPPLSPAT